MAERKVVRIGPVQLVAFALSMFVLAIVAFGRVLAGDDPVRAVLIGGAAAIPTAVVVMVTEQIRRRRRYLRAANAEDDRELRAAFEHYRAMYATNLSPRTRAHLALHEAGVLAREQRWAEAAATLDSIALDRLYPLERRSFVLLRASTLIHLGEPARALELVDAATTDARTDAEHVAVERLRGSALHHLGRDEEAIEVLARSAARAPRASVLHHLGASYERLGRLDDAIAAFGQAAAIPGDGAWRARAQQALAALEARRGPFR